jgi:hypothetical protein
VKAWLARLRTAYEGLSSQERMLVLVAGSLLAVFVLFLGVVNPILRAASSATLRVGSAEQELEAVRRLRREYDEVHGRLVTVEERIRSGPRGEIFTTLEKLASDSAVKIDSMEPRTSPAPSSSTTCTGSTRRSRCSRSRACASGRARTSPTSST